MTIDEEFPELAKLVADEGKTTLANLALPAGKEEDAIVGWTDLQNCAAVILRNKKTHPPDPVRADPYGYFATLNELLKLFNGREAPRKKLWEKLKVPGQNGSSFLDTVAEAALAVQLRQQGKTVALEVPFDPNLVLSKKDADIVVDYGSGKVWLDALSVQRGNSPPSTRADDQPSETQEPIFGMSEAAAVEIIATKAHRKYESKFEDAVKANLVESAGVLLCIMKNEEDLLVAFLARFIAREPLPDAPADFWVDHPKLDLVYVHTLRKKANSGSHVLHPVPVVSWRRPAP